MIWKKITLLILVTALTAIPINATHAYDPRTHANMSGIAVLRASLGVDSEFLWILGIGADPVSPMQHQYIETVEGGKFVYVNVDEVIRFGAREEDHNGDGEYRSLNHFFDPISHDPLSHPVLPFVQLFLGIPNVYSSQEWALELDGNLDYPEQKWSAFDMRNHVYQALTSASRHQSQEHWAKAFRSLGQVVHHVQDMAQPQHVRNDLHLDMKLCKNLSSDLCFYEPSFYEWISLTMSYGGYSNPLSGFMIPPSDAGNYPNVALYLNRHYWTHPSGYGMADYSNRNFVTADTNFLLDGQGNFATGEFSSPGVTGWQDEDIDGATLTGRDGEPLSGFVRLVKAPVIDNYLETAAETTHYTSSYSMFAQDIRDAIDAGVPPDRFDGRDFFYLNRLNFQSANDHLYRRAIGYSAGFIDHVFRGRLEIAPPEGNIYSVIDHAVTNEVGGDVLEGFTSIKLKLRNATSQQTSPDSSVAIDGHVIKAGKLVAVALFRPNPCYTPDLHGELDEGGSIANGCSISDWLETEQHRVVSAEIDLPDGLSSTEFTDFAFDFSANPIPVNARDLSIQVIFRGELGGDEDALAVARKDISEPTWFGGLNSTDHLGVDGVFQNAEEFLGSPEAEEWGIVGEEQQIAWGPQAIENVLYANRDTGERLTDWASLDELQYNRLAVLAEPGEQLAIRVTIFFQEFVHEYAYWFSPVETWLEEEAEVQHLPGYGDIVTLERHWYYTPIQGVRGVPGRRMMPLHLYLGAFPDLSAYETLPAIPDVGSPQPIPLHMEE